MMIASTIRVNFRRTRAGAGYSMAHAFGRYFGTPMGSPKRPIEISIKGSKTNSIFRKGTIMEKTIVETKKAGSNPINWQATKKNNIIFTSQKATINPESGKMVGIGNIRVQTNRVIQNILAIVEAGGATRKDIMKINIYIKDSKVVPELNEVYKSYFPDELPARCLIHTHFANDDILVEMDAIAIAG
jgi:2-iminobutanoate/2-iminopropanoate deaminase